MPDEPVKLDLRVVTPMFIGGTEPRGAPAELRAELRVQSVRGAMRWWLRALLAGCGVAGPNFTDTDKLWQEEAKVFGSVTYKERDDGLEQGGASPITLRLTDNTGPRDVREVTKVGRNPRLIAGQDYLLYGMHEQTGRNSAPARRAYQPGAAFDLHLGLRVGVIVDDSGEASGRDPQIYACAALWLLTSLGGLGARSRRGAGSLSVANHPNWPEQQLPTPPLAASPKELQQQLQAGVKSIRKLISSSYKYHDRPSSDKIEPEVSPYTVLHPDYTTIYVFDRTWRKWEDAMDEVGRAFAQFRSEEIADDNVAITSFLKDGTPPPQIERATFGLPLAFYFPQTRDRVGISWKGDDDKETRSASPVMLHFSPVGRDIALVLTIAYRELVPTIIRPNQPPEKRKLQIKAGGRPVLVDPPSNELASTLLEDFKVGLEDRLNADALQIAYRQEAQP